MKIKFFLYAPYNIYKTKFIYSKKRELNEFESIILLLIYDNKKNKPHATMINSLLERMNLLSKKEQWIDYILSILNKLNNKEIIIDNFNDIEYITNAEVEFDNNILKSIENDEYLGLDDNTVDKQFDLYYSLIENKGFKEKMNISDDEFSKILSNLKFKKVEQENNNISDKLNNYAEYVFNDSNYLFKKYELINEESFSKSQNIVWVKTNEIDYEINFHKNKITISDLMFENLRIFFKNEKLEEYFKEMITIVYENNKDPLYSKLKNQKTNTIDDFNLYLRIGELLESDSILNHDWIFLDGSIQEITYSVNKFTLNDEYEISLPILNSRIVTERELEEAIDKNYKNYDFCKILSSIKNSNQNELIKNKILDNYKDYYQIPFYHEYIKRNLSKINKLDIDWIVSNDFSNEDFEYCINNEEFKKKFIDLITDKKIKFITTNMIFKFNYIYSNLNLSIKNLKISLPLNCEYFKEQENINRIKQMMEKNKINEANQEINKFDKAILFMENKVLLNELIKTNKETMINNILKLMDFVTENIDKKYRDLSKIEKKSATPDECIKEIKAKSLLNNKEIAELDLIKKYRNKYTHERKVFNVELERKEFNDLQSDYEIILKYFGGKN